MVGGPGVDGGVEQLRNQAGHRVGKGGAAESRVGCKIALRHSSWVVSPKPENKEGDDHILAKFFSRWLKLSSNTLPNYTSSLLVISVLNQRIK